MGKCRGSGDTGETSGLNGQRISKNDPVIHFIGACDELNSHLGLVKALLHDTEARQFIEEIQKNIMKLMSHASDSADEKYFFREEDAACLERETDRLSQKNPEGFEFAIPGKNITEAQIHISRTIARRAERLFFFAREKQPLCKPAGAYLNRLSDYLFILSRQEIVFR
jgi:cob(I)alamin adenosyltransferase